MLTDNHGETEVPEGERWQGAGGKQVAGGREGRDAGQRGGGQLGGGPPPLWDVAPTTCGELFLAGITPELPCKQGLLKRREAQFKFPEVTLDGVRLSQEEVRRERKI